MREKTKRSAARTALVVGAAVVVVCAFVSMAQAGKGNQDNSGVLPPGANAFGMSYGEWAAEWEKWAFSVSPASNPVGDPTGEFAAEGQSGNVWFLAGTWGDSGPGGLTRTVEIPSGKALFFPIINQGWTTLPGDVPPGEDPDEWFAENEGWIRELLAWIMDEVADLSCEIDGVPVQNIEQYRVFSPVFDVYLPEDNLWDTWGIELPEGIYGPCLDTGYYLLAPPLSVGEHTISFHAVSLFWGNTQDVTYEITVTPGSK